MIVRWCQVAPLLVIVTMAAPVSGQEGSLTEEMLAGEPTGTAPAPAPPPQLHLGQMDWFRCSKACGRRAETGEQGQTGWRLPSQSEAKALLERHGAAVFDPPEKRVSCALLWTAQRQGLSRDGNVAKVDPRLETAAAGDGAGPVAFRSETRNMGYGDPVLGGEGAGGSYCCICVTGEGQG